MATTNKNNSLTGYNSIDGATDTKIVGGSFKGGGTTVVDLDIVGLVGVATMDGSSNDVIASSVIAGSTPVGTSIHYTMIPSGINAPDEIRVGEEVNQGNRNATTDGFIHQQVSGREVITRALTMTNDGRWLNSSGVQVDTPVGSGYAIAQIAAGSGDTALRGRNQVTSYFYAQGNGPSEQNLPGRTQ